MPLSTAAAMIRLPCTREGDRKSTHSSISLTREAER